MRLYLDDIRATPHDFDIRTYTAPETIEFLKGGRVTHISLDHDLDGEGNLDPSETGTGYDVAKWIEQAAHDGTLPRLTWAVHSMNASGAARIKAAMQSADRQWDAQGKKVHEAHMLRSVGSIYFLK